MLIKIILLYLCIFPLKNFGFILQSSMLKEKSWEDFKMNLHNGSIKHNYYSYAEITEFFKSLPGLHPMIKADVDEIGYSHAGNLIYSLSIASSTSSNYQNHNQTILPPTAVFVYYLQGFDLLTINILIELVCRIYYGVYHNEEYFIRLIDQRRLLLLGPANPDTLIYLEDHYKLTKRLVLLGKNRNYDATEEDLCGESGAGVSITHNFEYMFGLDNKGSSNDTCHPNYRGKFPMSENETQTIQSFFALHNSSVNNIQLVIGLSVKGNSLVLPYSFRESVLPADQGLNFIENEAKFIEGFQLGTLWSLDNKTLNGDLCDYIFKKFSIPTGRYRIGSEVEEYQTYHPNLTGIQKVAKENLPILLYFLEKAGDFIVFKYLSQGICARNNYNFQCELAKNIETSYYVNIIVNNTGISHKSQPLEICIKFSNPHFYTITHIFDNKNKKLTLFDDKNDRSCGFMPPLNINENARNLTIILTKNQATEDKKINVSTAQQFLIIENRYAVMNEFNPLSIQITYPDFWRFSTEKTLNARGNIIVAIILFIILGIICGPIIFKRLYKNNCKIFESTNHMTLAKEEYTLLKITNDENEYEAKKKKK